MDLSPGEEALIHMVRAGSLGDFGLTLTRKHDTFVLTFASPEENGIGGGDGEPAPAPACVLQLVGGTAARVAS